MKKGIWNTLKGVLGVLLLVGVGFGIFYWESYGREQMIYGDVLLLKEDVKERTIITEDLLVIGKRDHKNIIEDAITDPVQVVGLETKHFIPKNSQLVGNYFESPDLVLNEDQFIFRIPNDWLKSYPSTLRRKDRAYFYPVEKERTEIDLSEVKHLSDSICDMTVAYVKDGGNKEVLSESNDDRLDGSSTVSSIELIATMKEVNLLRYYQKRGFEFIVLYQ